MGKNVTEKIIADHLLYGEMNPGEEIGLKIDQTLTQDATGTMVMLELEAMELDRVQTEASAQYVDHNLIQVDYKNQMIIFSYKVLHVVLDYIIVNQEMGLVILYICSVLLNQGKHYLALIVILVRMAAWGCLQWGLGGWMSQWP